MKRLGLSRVAALGTWLPPISTRWLARRHHNAPRGSVKILYISWTRIGDAVLSTGVLHELVRRHPGASVTVVCGPLAQSLFANVPGLERVIALPKRRFNLHWLELWRQVVDQRWDLVVDLRRSLTAYALKARERRILGTTDNTRHRVAWLPTIIDHEQPLSPHLWISEKQHVAAQNLLPGDRPTLAIAPIAARPEKTWPAENFAALVSTLCRPGGLCHGWRILLVAGPGEESQFQPLIADISAEDRVMLTREPDLLVVGAALARAQLYIGNDSGMTHLAAAAGTPTMALFGPTDPKTFGPWSDRACVVEAPAHDGARNIAHLSVEAVAAAVTEMLQHATRSR
jgi:heptosyltransferase III